MASKKCFIYRIEYGNNENGLEKDFCYARNADVALAEMKKIHKCNLFHAIAVGEANIEKHPEPFELMPEDEKKYLDEKRGTIGETYSARTVKGPTFVPVGEMEQYERNILQS